MYEDSFTFSYKNIDGQTYVAEVELEVEPATEANFNQALSDWDTQDHVEIVNLRILNMNGELTSGVDPTDEHILRECELEVSMREDMPTEDTLWEKY